MLAKPRLAGLALILLLSVSPSHIHALPNEYTEDFTTKDYCDTLHTTAHWNTTAGRLELQPFELAQLAALTTSGNPNHVVVAGDYAFVADYEAGLKVIDIADPTAPVVVGECSTTWRVYEVAVSGDYLYAADGVCLTVVDISDPTSPFVVATCGESWSAQYVKVVGDYAYVGAVTDGFRVVDISDPTNPIPVGACTSLSYARGLDIAGDYAFAASMGGGLQVVDITDPTDPHIVAGYDLPQYTWNVTVDGDYAYVCNGDGLRVFDVSEPTDPVLAGAYDTDAPVTCAMISGDYAYVNSWRLKVLDVTDPTNPTLVTTGSFDGAPTSVTSLALAGDFAVVTDFYTGVRLIDIADLVSPSPPVGGYDTPGICLSMDIEGDYAYVADHNSGIQILNIADPTSPVLVSCYPAPTGCYDVDVDGDNLFFVAEDETLFTVLDISDPLTPIPIGQCWVPFSGEAIEVAGEHAFLASRHYGLQVIDISDPSNPELVGSFQTSDSAGDVAISGDYAYVAVGGDDLQVVDISDPMNPTLAGSYSGYGSFEGIAIAGDYAFVAHEWYGDSGLVVLDISDPTNPAFLGRCVTYGHPKGKPCVVGDYVFLADRGLTAIDVRDPANPHPIGNDETHISTSNVVVAGDWAFVAARYSGLQVMEVFQRRVDPERDLARSVPVNEPGAVVIQARLDADEVGDIGWELSADGGVSWETVQSNGGWHAFSTPGDELLWRSTLRYGGVTADPKCELLVVEFVTEETPVEGTFYAALTESGSALLRWKVPEVGAAEGFYICRSTSQSGPFLRLNDELLPPESSGSFEDVTVWPETGFWYQLRALFADGSDGVMCGSLASITTEGMLVPHIGPPNPNPSSGETSFQLEVPGCVGHASLTIYNIRGQEVRKLAEGSIERGRPVVLWNGKDQSGRDVSAGVYLVRLEVGRESRTRKVIVLR